MMGRVVLAIAVAVFAAGAPAYAAVDPGALCKEKKAKAAGKKAADLMKSFGKNIKKTDPAKLAEDVSKAQSKFTKAFTKTEGAGGCDTTGDAAAIEAKVDAAVADLVLKLTNICGDDSRAGIEQCDGTDASECPGLCLANCTCPEPICNNGSKEVGEECDPAGSTVDCGTGEICGGFCECVPNVPCNCGSTPPTRYTFRTLPPAPGSICGTADGIQLQDLECGGLYIGGGGGDLSVPAPVPDQSWPIFNIAQCVGTDLTTAPATQAEVGKRHCNEGKTCVGGDNDGQPCLRHVNCPGGTCKAWCFFTSYVPNPNRNNPVISTCLGNEMLEAGSGGVDCATGRMFIRVPSDVRIHLTGRDMSPTTPGWQVCPICLGGTLDVPNSGVCSDGPNKNLPCMPMDTSWDLHSCCEGGSQISQHCTDNDDCPGSTCIPGCTGYPTSLDCPPHPLTDIGGLWVTLNLNTEDQNAYDNTKVANADGEFCGWCRDMEVESTLCFEGDTDNGPPDWAQQCPDSSVIACRPATYWNTPIADRDPADIVDCEDPVPCRTDLDCTPPYETCTQRNPGAWRDATIRTVVYDQGLRPGDLRDGDWHSPSVLVTNICIPPTYDGSKDNSSDLPGPGGISVMFESRLIYSP